MDRRLPVVPRLEYQAQRCRVLRNLGEAGLFFVAAFSVITQEADAARKRSEELLAQWQAGGETFQQYVGKIIDPAFLFDVGVETVDLLVPGGGIIGFIIGAFIGAFVFEMMLGKTRNQAFKAGLCSFIGF